MSELTEQERTDIRRLLDIRAIQETILRYARAVDRNDAELMQTIFWDEGTDNHGHFNGSAREFFALAVMGRDRLSARQHLEGPVQVEFIGADQAKVETYYQFVGVFVIDGVKGPHNLNLPDTDTEQIGVSGGRYMDLFERRHGEWRILRRTVVKDWCQSYDYKPAWQFFNTPEGVNRGTVAPNDATYASDW